MNEVLPLLAKALPAYFPEIQTHKAYTALLDEVDKTMVAHGDI